MSGVLEGVVSSDEEPVPRISPEPEEVEDEGQFAFRRNKLCSYHLVRMICNISQVPFHLGYLDIFVIFRNAGLHQKSI